LQPVSKYQRASQAAY